MARDAAARSAPTCGRRLRRCPPPFQRWTGERRELSPVEDRLWPFPCLPAGMVVKKDLQGQVLRLSQSRLKFVLA